MKRITVFCALSLVGIVFSYPLIGFGQDRSQDQNCGRLKTGDSFNRINEILDCIETKIGVIQSSKDPISQSKESTVIALPGHPLGSAKEPNDRIYDATPIVFGSSIQGKLTKNDLTDWYVFKTLDSADGKAIIVFRWIEGESISVKLALYDADEKGLKSWNICCKESGSVDINIDKNNTYYVKASSQGVNNYTVYKLSVRYKSTEAVR
jgi:hypothetical protein